MSQTPPAYSPFWAILLLSVGLLVLQFSNVIDTANQRKRAEAALAESANAFSRAQTILLTTDRVGRDLIGLATAGSTESAKIVSEFKMQVNGAGPAK